MAFVAPMEATYAQYTARRSETGSHSRVGNPPMLWNAARRGCVAARSPVVSPPLGPAEPRPAPVGPCVGLDVPSGAYPRRHGLETFHRAREAGAGRSGAWASSATHGEPSVRRHRGEVAPAGALAAGVGHAPARRGDGRRRTRSDMVSSGRCRVSIVRVEVIIGRCARFACFHAEGERSPASLAASSGKSVSLACRVGPAGPLDAMARSPPRTNCSTSA